MLSPVFKNGCNKITFEYGIESLEPMLKIEVLKENVIVYDSLITSIPKGWTEFSEDFNIEGEFQLKFTIESPYPCGDETAMDFTQRLLSFRNICITPKEDKNIIPEHNYQINAPKEAIVFVGDKDRNITVAGNYLTKHYVPFTPQKEVYILETDTSNIWYYNLATPTTSTGFNYRISREGNITQVGIFKPKTGTNIEKDTLLTFTENQLNSYSPKEINHDVTSLNGRNVADIFININAQGYLTLPLQEDTVFRLIHTRNWQAIDSDVNNYFIEPDFNYTVIDENGQPCNDIISISNDGVIKPIGEGTAIVLIDYDAMVCYHTSNLGAAAGLPVMFSKLWPENTGVFVVSVAQPEANIKTNMTVSEFWSQDGTDKTDSINIDAEHDILYFEAEKGSFEYTFKPQGVNSLSIATPIIGEFTTI